LTAQAPLSSIPAPVANPSELSPSNDAAVALWKQVSSTLQSEVSVDTFRRWFQDVRPVSLDDRQLTLCVPNSIHQLWIESNYQSLLHSALMLATGSGREIVFVFDPTPALLAPDEQAQAADAGTSADSYKASSPGGNGLNPRNTFESFVVGTNNQFAHAACSAVANGPGKTYNPLFIYSGVGLGKTHLMHAIGHQILGSKKNARVMYITSEHFTNEFIDAIQTGTLAKFRKRYRQAEVLLIDDIQFLAGKERSQEEFFHTFNALFDGHKQIVLSSDRPPSEIANLESRLVSRFEWGLTAEMQPPEVETRIAILRKKSQTMQVKLPSEVLNFLAERIRTNVRRLEGGLMRVASYTSLNDGKVPSPEKIEMLLKDILQEEARKAVTIEQIQKRVAEHFDIRLADMTSKRRPANIAFPRQIAMYLSRELTRSSLTEIGEAFGGRDHGTVLHAHRQVVDKMTRDERTRNVVSFLDNQLQR
jgi:chromosomal replication initiator protein